MAGVVDFVAAAVVVSAVVVVYRFFLSLEEWFLRTVGWIQFVERVLLAFVV